MAKSFRHKYFLFFLYIIIFYVYKIYVDIEIFNLHHTTEQISINQNYYLKFQLKYITLMVFCLLIEQIL